MGSNSGEFIVPHLIGGKDSLEKLNLLIDVISPHTNKSCWKAVSANPQDAIAAVEAAQAAFPAWSITKPDSRRDILLKAANILEARAEEYAGYVVTEIGVDVGVAKHIIVPLALRMLRDIACRISSICGSVPVCESKGQSALVLKEPYGVVLGIVPWWVNEEQNSFNHARHPQISRS
jgi:acyl-CoA reductase-like NAD-dependent aldehyde dehydrogenase